MIHNFWFAWLAGEIAGPVQKAAEGFRTLANTSSPSTSSKLLRTRMRLPVSLLLPLPAADLAWLIHQKQNRSAECGLVTEERLGAPSWTGKEVCTAARLISRTVFRNSSALSFRECAVEEA